MKNHQTAQVKSRPSKGWLFLFLKKALPALAAILLISLLSGCEKGSETLSEDSAILIQETPAALPEEAPADQSDGRTEESQTPGGGDTAASSEPKEPEESAVIQSEESTSETRESEDLYLEVIPGEYLIEIIEDLAEKENALGRSTSPEELLGLLEEAYKDLPEEGAFSRDQNLSELALPGEGYIPPGKYLLSSEEEPVVLIERLVNAWRDALGEEDWDLIGLGDRSFQEVLTMATIIEFESSKTTDDEVKYLVASVVRNRLESETPLEMDVTVFYLQEGLQPYRDPADYELSYDTYEASALPPGPICTPSPGAIRAALSPADTEYFFFIYDEEGNYYFAEDYETHLSNVETYLD